MLANDHYTILGIQRDANLTEIKQAYRELVRRFHPDADLGTGETERFLRIQEAYETLSNAQLRADYDRNLPTVEKPIEVNVLYSSSFLPLLKEPQWVYVLLDLLPRQPSKSIKSPLMNIGLVLDCSNSMKGSRIEQVKAAVVAIMRHLKGGDILSIIAFNDRARVVLPATLCSQAERMEMTVHLLRAEGGTEIYQGLKSGYDEVRRFATARSLNHLILLTDGHTYGDEQKCFSLAALAKEQGIGISGLGIGSEWNDIFLDQLCNMTGGSAVYVARDSNIKALVQQKISQLSRSYGSGVNYHYVTGQGVDLRYILRLQPDTAPLPIERKVLPLGNLPSDRPLSLLFEFLVDVSQTKQSELTLAEGRLYMSLFSEELANYSIRLDLRRPLVAGARPQEPPLPIAQAVSRLNLYRLQESAQEALEKSNVEGATQHLKNLATHLYSQGESDLARRVLAEIRQIQHSQTLSAEGKKEIKYGTRALLLPAQAGDERG